MNQVVEDALRATFQFIGQTVMFFVGILGCVAVTCLSLSGEVIDELTTYKESGPFPWVHVAKVMLPPSAVAIAAYIQHRKMMANAINSPVSPDVRATVTSQKAPKEEE